MGLFDVKGFTDIKPQIGLGSPLFKKITIKLNKKYYKGTQFVIEAKNSSDKNIYVKSFKYNNKVLHQPFLPLADVLNGGKLSLDMGKKPVNIY